MSHKLSGDARQTLPLHFSHPLDCVCVACVRTDINSYGVLSTPPPSPEIPRLKRGHSLNASEHSYSLKHKAGACDGTLCLSISERHSNLKHVAKWPHHRLKALAIMHRESDDADDSES